MNRFSCLTGIPEFTKGQVREIRIRWALEELGVPFEEIRYPHPETKKYPYLDKQPFGQVPYFESDDVTMFETGAILLYLAEKHQKLLPQNLEEKAQIFTWIFAALNSVEPYIWHFFILKNDQEAPAGIRQRAKELAEQKVAVISEKLGSKEFIGAQFSIADIIMTSVLKTAHLLELTGPHQNLSAFVKRMEARPACQRALQAHYKLYERNT